MKSSCRGTRNRAQKKKRDEEEESITVCRLVLIIEVTGGNPRGFIRFEFTPRALINNSPRDPPFHSMPAANESFDPAAAKKHAISTSLDAHSARAASLGWFY